MDEIFTQIKTYNWWFSVVIMGIIISLLSNFIQKKLTKYTEKRKRRISIKSAKEQEEIENAVIEILEIKDGLIYYQQETTQKLIQFIIIVGAGVFMMALIQHFSNQLM